MTKAATIAGLNAKIHVLTNAVTRQISTMRGQFGAMLGISHSGKRDIYDVYGYPVSLSGTSGFNYMYKYSRRMGIANRVTWGMAKTCWRDGFEVFETVDDVEKDLLSDQISQIKKSGFDKKIEQADILNRIGRMSVLFVGVPDGREPDEEIGPVVNGKNNLDLLYFTAYAYDGAEIAEQEQDKKNPRYGLPKYYTLQRIPREDNEKDISVNAIRAHWTRVIHLNENALDSDIEGMGCLEPVMNRVLDIDKATGGASEAYFRNAKGKIAYEIDKEFSAGLLTDQAAKDSFQEGAEKYTNNFQDHTVAAGSTVKSLTTAHYSPLDTIKVALWEISGYTGIPIRILTGEGAGQLAGSEDQLAYNQIVRDRQRLVCSIWINALFDILQKAKMIELPDNYEIRFPVQEASTEREKAEVGDTKAATIEKIAKAKSSPGGDDIDTEKAYQQCGIDDILLDEPEPIKNPDKDPE